MQLQKPNSSNYIFLLIATGLFLMYVLGIFWPDIFWGTHFLAFLPSTLKYGISFLVIVIIFYAYFGKTKDSNFTFRLSTILITIISITASVVFYNLDITNDYYGDAKNFSPYLDQKFLGFRENFWEELFSLQFKTGHARWGVFNFYSIIAFILKIDMLQAFKLMDAFFGGGFVLVWLLAIRNYASSSLVTIVLAILGCTAPAMLIFCGHIETYGLVCFLLLSWLCVFVKAFKKKSVFLLWLLIPLLLVCIRFNTPSILLTPALILGFIHHYYYNDPKVLSLFQAKRIFRIVLIPLIIMGFGVYFFVLGDYNDSRILDSNTKDIDRLFLPLFSPEPPLDTYNLLSWNHIFDFLMVLFFWSPGILFLSSVLFVNRKKIIWDTPLLTILLMTLVLLLGFLFMINPLMSLPMDWDLYVLPFPLVLIILLLMLQKQSTSIINIKTMTYTLGLHLLSIPVFIVMMHKTMHSYRIESVGVRVYKTYYQHSDSFMLYALQMLNGKERYETRKEKLLHKLKPHIRGKTDQNYAALLLDEGINAFADKEYIKSRKLLLSAESYAPYLKLTQEFLVKANKEFIRGQLPISDKNKKTADSLVVMGLEASRRNKFFKKALQDFRRASYYDPYSPEVPMFQMETYFIQKDFKNAFHCATQLITLQYPSEQESLRFGVHCALEAEKYNDALKYAKKYLEKWPEDQFLKEIYIRLKNKDSVSELKFKFAKK